MQVTVGECMRGALQSAFREPAFLPKGGDAPNSECGHDNCTAIAVSLLISIPN